MEFMVGNFKYKTSSVDEALSIAKKKMLEMGWRNLRLMKKYSDGWGVCCSIPALKLNKSVIVGGVPTFLK